MHCSASLLLDKLLEIVNLLKFRGGWFLIFFFAMLLIRSTLSLVCGNRDMIIALKLCRVESRGRKNPCKAQVLFCRKISELVGHKDKYNIVFYLHPNVTFWEKRN